MIIWLHTVPWLWISFISVCCWSAITVTNSVVARTYRISPMTTLWIQAFYNVCILSVLGVYLRPTPGMLWLLLPASVTAYLADLYFFYAVKRLDISLINVGLCLQSFLMSIIGFTVYHDPLTPSMLFGAFIILCGVLLLSLYGSSVRGTAMLRWFLPLVVIYFPLNIARKVGVEHGIPLLSILFYLTFLRDLLGTVVPLIHPSLRSTIHRELREQSTMFFCLSGLPVVVFLCAEFLQTMLFDIGPLSGVSLVGNIQPFMTLGLTMMLAKAVPSSVQIESFEMSHVRIKIIAFTFTLVGLALVGGSA